MGKHNSLDQKLQQFEYTCSHRHSQLGCMLKGLREMDEWLKKLEKIVRKN